MAIHEVAKIIMAEVRETFDEWVDKEYTHGLYDISKHLKENAGRERDFALMKKNWERS